MKKYIPIVISLLIVVFVAIILVNKKNSKVIESKKIESMGNFSTQKSYSSQPKFLSKLKVTKPVTIDLSQQQFTGLAFLFGQNFSKVVHPKAWERFEHFSTYALDRVGNIFLAPMPFISIKPTTFNLQKNIYKLDSITGKLSIFMSLEDVIPSSSNPYGVISLVYDFDDESLWVSAIDESNYREEKGIIYHIDINNKRILQRFYGTDALTLNLLKTTKGKILLVGSARKNLLYAFPIEKNHLLNKRTTLLTLPFANEFIRKIKIRKNNELELQTIPFSYTLIAQTSLENERKEYKVRWDSLLNKFSFY